MRNIANVRARRMNSTANRIGRLWLNRLEDRTTPTTFTVNLTGDTGVGTGDTGDIRYVMGLANANGLDDIINFEFASATTITLTADSITLTGEVAISDTALLTMTVPTGKGAVTIDANSTGRIFAINTQSPVTISNLTMTKGLVSGADGGAINLVGGGSLTVNNCVINGNTAGATNTTSGGGIAVGPIGTLVLRNSTISGNKGGRGGGIYFFNGGSLTVENCTFSKNTQGNSANGGGAIYFYGIVEPGGFTISNSTISSNTAFSRGGAVSIVNGEGTFDFRNSTITGNVGSTAGGGIATTGSKAKYTILNIQSSIVSGNVHGSSPDIFHAYTTNINYSLIGAGGAGHVITGANNLTGTLASPLDAKLGALANNGGPTQTHLPVGGSPVRNKGNNPAALTTDQRGLVRVVDGKIDIGSVESTDPAPSATLVAVPDISTPGATTPNTVSIVFADLQSTINVSTIDINDITITAPDGFTKLAITNAVSDKAVNSTPVTGTYTFTIPGGTWDVADVGFYTVAIKAGQVFDTDGTPSSVAAGNIGTFKVTIPQTFTVDITTDEDDGNTTKGDISLREALKMANAVPGSADSITFDSTVFATQKTITLTLGELSVTDRVTLTGPAAKVVVDANKLSRVMNVTIAGIGNIVNLSNLIVTNGLLAGTGADKRGGGIFVEDEHVTLTNCTLSKNSAEATGGGIYLRGNTFPTEPGSITLIDSTVSQNASTGSGGFRIGAGGGISIDLAGKLVMSRSTVSGNSANTQGGGIYFVVSGSTDISNSAITGNTAAGGTGGGGFYFYGTVISGLKITNSTISGNSATAGPGGGIALNTFNGTSKLQIFNSTITANEANSGAGISLTSIASPDPLSLSSTIVAGNNALTAIGMDIGIEVATNVSGDNNLIGIADDGNATFTGTGNVNGTQATPQDAKLGALSSLNGGPTATHALLTGSAAINAGNNLLALATDQRGPGFVRVGGVSADIGAFEVQPAATAAKVTGVAINSKLLTPADKAQRSRVTDVAITFDSKVSFVGGDVNAAAAFSLNRVSPTLGAVTLAASVNNTGPGTVVTLTFTGGAVDNVSLADGRYAFHALAAQFASGLDGDGNGTGGDDFLFDEPPAPAPLVMSRLFRIFGDYNGDGNVATNDFIEFRLALGGSSFPFDFDNDGTVATSDFIQFRLRFGGSI